MSESFRKTRRTKRDIEEMIAYANRVIAEEKVVSMRHLFYKIVSVGLADKSGNEYTNIDSIINDARIRGQIPWSAFVDGGRDGKTIYLESNLKSFMDGIIYSYRRDYWQSQGKRVEIWYEKDAFGPTVAPLQETYRINLYSTRGQAGDLMLHTAKKRWDDYHLRGQMPVVLYVGDLDPAGIQIPRTIQAKMADPTIHNAPPFEFHIVGLHQHQVEKYKVMTRPVNLEFGSSGGKEKANMGLWRSLGMGDLAADIDAMETSTWRDIISEEIEKHIDPFMWGIEIATERDEIADGASIESP